MMKMTEQRRDKDSFKLEGNFTKGFIAAIGQGTVSIPHLLLQYYPKLELSDAEAMLLIHIISFKEKEDKDFPTIDELQFRMSTRPDLVVDMLQKMMQNQLLSIDEQIDPLSGVQSEKYNLQPIYEKLALCYMASLEEASEPNEP